MSTTPAVPSETTIRKATSEFGLPVDDKQVVQIQQYIKLLLLWNDKINLTAIRDPLEILYRHFCESMYAAVAVPVENCRLADVGSGAGFPGIPLKICKPELEVFLIESNLKKGTFMAEVTRELGLTGAKVLIDRYEESAEAIAPVDIVSSRALGDFGPFLNWAGSSEVAAKQVVLWVGSRDLDEVRKLPGWQWREPIPVPQSLRRLLLVGDRIVVPVSA